jgi:lipoprotein NlpD
MRRVALCLVCLFGLALSACQSNPPAPVIERTKPVSKPKPAVSKKIESPSNKDWRPDTYVVKKGDTLFAIGLENGLDYKEIAAANNIASPYTIKVGQTLDLTSFKTKNTNAGNASNTATTTPANSKTEDGVVLSPIKTEPAVVAVPTGGTATDAKPAPSAVTPILVEPKASREVYSQEAWNRPTSKPTVVATKPAAVGTLPTDAKSTEVKPAEAKPVEAKPADSKPTEAKPNTSTTDDSEAMDWNWPTQGKISAGFNESSNKGIDIAGTMGQAITAAAPGKVIYSGSDLRGYGKLVIIKHNKTYLSVYAHNSKILVKEGQSVSAKQTIAEMGNSDTNSVKLHFEIRRLGKSVDPSKYLSQN